MSSSSSAPTTSASRERTSSEKGSWSATGRGTPRASATAQMSCSIGGGEHRGAPVADEAALDEGAEGLDGLLDRCGRVGPVQLVEVDVVGAEAAEALLARRGDPRRRQALALDRRLHREADLGGQHDLVATARDGPADQLLGHPVAVGVGGVDQVDAPVEGGVDDGHALVGVGARGGEGHGAEPEGRDLGPAGAETTTGEGGVRSHARLRYSPTSTSGSRRQAWPDDVSHEGGGGSGRNGWRARR